MKTITIIPKLAILFLLSILLLKSANAENCGTTINNCCVCDCTRTFCDACEENYYLYDPNGDEIYTQCVSDLHTLQSTNNYRGLYSSDVCSIGGQSVAKECNVDPNCINCDYIDGFTYCIKCASNYFLFDTAGCIGFDKCVNNLNTAQSSNSNRGLYSLSTTSTDGLSIALKCNVHANCLECNTNCVTEYCTKCEAGYYRYDPTGGTEYTICVTGSLDTLRADNNNRGLYSISADSNNGQSIALKCNIDPNCKLCNSAGYCRKCADNYHRYDSTGGTNYNMCVNDLLTLQSTNNNRGLYSTESFCSSDGTKIAQKCTIDNCEYCDYLTDHIFCFKCQANYYLYDPNGGTDYLYCIPDLQLDTVRGDNSNRGLYSDSVCSVQGINVAKKCNVDPNCETCDYISGFTYCKTCKSNNWLYDSAGEGCIGFDMCVGDLKTTQPTNGGRVLFSKTATSTDGKSIALKCLIENCNDCRYTSTPHCLNHYCTKCDNNYYKFDSYGSGTLTELHDMCVSINNLDNLQASNSNRGLYSTATLFDGSSEALKCNVDPNCINCMEIGGTSFCKRCRNNYYLYHTTGGSNYDKCVDNLDTLQSTNNNHGLYSTNICSINGLVVARKCTVDTNCILCDYSGSAPYCVKCADNYYLYASDGGAYFDKCVLDTTLHTAQSSNSNRGLYSTEVCSKVGLNAALKCNVDANCVKCDYIGGATYCLECAANYFLFDTAGEGCIGFDKCVKNLNDPQSSNGDRGLYSKSATSTDGKSIALKCNIDNCLECAYTSTPNCLTTYCTKCKADYFLFDTYGESLYDMCVLRTNLNTAQASNINRGLYSVSAYSTEGKSVAQKCNVDANCLECAWSGSVVKCTKCRTNYHLHDSDGGTNYNMCVNDLLTAQSTNSQRGLYSETSFCSSNGLSVAKKCINNCKVCDWEYGVQYCIACDADYYLYDSCAIGDGKYDKCVSNLHTLQSTNKGSGTSQDRGLYSSQVCSTGGESIAQNCNVDPQCINCDYIAGAIYCLKCAANYFLFDTAGCIGFDKCVHVNSINSPESSNSNRGLYSSSLTSNDGLSIAKKCEINNCLQCAYTSTPTCLSYYCTKCEANYYLYDTYGGTLYDKCVLDTNLNNAEASNSNRGLYSSEVCSTGGQSVALKCEVDPNCKKCYNNGSVTFCIECAPNYYLYDSDDVNGFDKCVSDLHQAQTTNNNRGLYSSEVCSTGGQSVAKKCNVDPNCIKCDYIQGAVYCLQCANNYYLFDTAGAGCIGFDKCVSTLSDPQSSNGNRGLYSLSSTSSDGLKIALKCDVDENCLECETPGNCVTQKCTKCKAGYYLFDSGGQTEYTKCVSDLTVSQSPNPLRGLYSTTANSNDGLSVALKCSKPSNCVTCLYDIGSNTFYCSKCETGYYLWDSNGATGGTRYDYCVEGTATLECVNVYSEGSNTGTGVALDCTTPIPNCQKCTYSATLCLPQCTRCDSTYFLYASDSSESSFYDMCVGTLSTAQVTNSNRGLYSEYTASSDGLKIALKCPMSNCLTCDFSCSCTKCASNYLLYDSNLEGGSVYSHCISISDLDSRRSENGNRGLYTKSSAADIAAGLGIALRCQAPCEGCLWEGSGFSCRTCPNTRPVYRWD